MESISIKKEFKEDMEQIWNNPRFLDIEGIDRGYAVQDEIIKGAILFIGINPSFSGKHLIKVSHFYNNVQQGEVYSYFRKFQDIAIKTNQKWAHLDLLFVRETNQKNVEKIFLHKHGKEFIGAQLDLSKKIIESAEPKVIVVSNAFARVLIQSRFKSVFDDNIGTHKIIENLHLANIPIFFTSMLTGQRALDLGSYERLIWHINYAVNFSKSIQPC